jgi:predicted lysophospholipase L1 biosynthesis ABC-type transport system permease subunit
VNHEPTRPGNGVYRGDEPAVGVANIMIISVLERRFEIGLRRALGATRAQIRTRFLAESVLLAVVGGIVGVLAGQRQRRCTQARRPGPS